MEKALKVKCDNCGAIIFLTRNKDGDVVQETVKPEKPAEKESEKSKGEEKDEWFI